MDTSKLHLTTVEKVVLNKIDDNLEFFVSNNLHSLARKYFVGQATIIRLVRKLGFSSLKKMQFAYSNKLSLENISKIDFSKKDLTVKNLIQETSALSIYPILETIKDLDFNNFEKIINQIQISSIIIIFSIGTAKYAAQYLYSSLLATGQQLLKITSIEEFFKIKEFYQQTNVIVIIFSNSGLQKEVIKVFNNAQTKNWTTLWIGSSRSLKHTTPLQNSTYKLSYKVHYAEKNAFPAISAINGQIFIANILANCLLKTLPKSAEQLEHLNNQINTWYFD